MIENTTQIVPSTNNIDSVIDKIMKQNQYVSNMSDIIMTLVRAGALIPTKNWFGRTYYVTPDWVSTGRDSYGWRYDTNYGPWVVIRDDGAVGSFDNTHGEWGFGIFFSLVGSIVARCNGFGNWVLVSGALSIIFCIYKIVQFKKYGNTDDDANIPFHLNALYDTLNNTKLLQIPTYE
jgi:hypothetical protein